VHGFLCTGLKDQRSPNSKDCVLYVSDRAGQKPIIIC